MIAEKPPVFHWEMFYKHYTAPYYDRHWLWSFIPELFPVPPNHSWKEVVVYKFVCPICGRIYPLTATCNHIPVYYSAIDLGSANLKGVHVPFAEPRPPFLRVLDVGCGTGSTCFPLLEKNGAVHVTAFDYSSKAIDWLKSRYFFDPARIAVTVDDACSFYLDGVFDVILVIFVLSSVEDFEQVILRCKSHLAHEGLICIVDYTMNDDKVTKRETLPVKGGLLCKRGGNATSLLGFDTGSLQAIVKDMGLEIYDTAVHERMERNRKTGFEFVRSYFVLKCGVQKKD